MLLVFVGLCGLCNLNQVYVALLPRGVRGFSPEKVYCLCQSVSAS